jgi:putative CocE/NonD family hydrolase
MRKKIEALALAGMRIVLPLVFCLIAAPHPAGATAPDLEFHAPATTSDPSTSAIMRDLAERLLPVYQEADPDRYLANLSALQMVAGDYPAAYGSRQSLRDRRRRKDAGQRVDRAVIYDMYASARAMEAENRIPFAEAFTKSFHEVMDRLDDQDAYAVTQWLERSLPEFQDALQRSLDQLRAGGSVNQDEAVELIRAYLSYDIYRTVAPLVSALDTEEDHRRYTADAEVRIKTPGGASIYAVVVRPKSPAKPLPALLELTILDSPTFAKECAAHGYAGVVAYTRGKHDGAQPVVPYQHDGEDARTVINWIAKQAWSDGRVGMYGEGYSGFTAWAAATRVPTALKAIATSAGSAPGIDVPMRGSVFQNSAYRWSLSVTDPKESDDKKYDDDALWRSLDQKWYRSGRSYRELGRVFGTHNPIFIRWLNHPSYDRFWQKMIPYREQFAHINIPVLTTTGYFAASEPAALYYFTEHYRYNPRADHTLLIGPYDDSVMQRGVPAVLHGYEVDSTAVINLHALRYEWLDHVFKGSATPALLKERINYEVMGANAWRHAPTLEAMGKAAQRFYLDATASREGYRLTRRKNAKLAFVHQTVSLADRRDAGWMPPADLISKDLVSHNSLQFASEPLSKPTEFSGLFSGRLDFTVNKMDVDLNIVFYERLANGDYVRLFNPTYEFRASYVRDRVHRHLLKAGERQELPLIGEHLTSRELRAGSRLVVVLGVNKRPDREINYGTGNDVSEESIDDARVPLKIRWYNDSYIDIPVRK